MFFNQLKICRKLFLFLACPVLFFLSGACVSSSSGAAVVETVSPTETVSAEQKVLEITTPALKDLFKNDFYIGCLLSYQHVGFESDPPVEGQQDIVAPTGGVLIKHHMNSMSPGNWMKSKYIVDIEGSAAAYEDADTQADKDYIDVHPRVVFNGNIIAQLNWARRQGFTFRGHTLVWHQQTPGTDFFRSGYTSDGQRLSKEKMTARMENYIKEVIRIIHEGWPGLLSAMDVVNEAVNEDGTDREHSEWYKTFGDSSYVMKAFQFARKYTLEYGEPQMKLYYNDYSTFNPGKADGIVRLCGPIFKAGYLDGIGMQEHDYYTYPKAEEWIASYNKFDAICTEMAVTELDVGLSEPAVIPNQANQYAMLFKCFLDRSYRSGRGKIVSVSKDGLNDKMAFVKFASLWDADNQPKETFFTVVDLVENYYALESLFANAGTLKEEDYTRESWDGFTAALASAKKAMADNYSNEIPAAEVLGREKDNLQAAIDNLINK